MNKQRSGKAKAAGRFSQDLIDAEFVTERYTKDARSKFVTRMVQIGKYKGITRLPMKTGSINVGELALAAHFDKLWLTSELQPDSEAEHRHADVRVVDIFAGCGGLSVGVREAVTALGGGFVSMFASDIDEGALSVYSSNLHPREVSSSPIETIFNKELAAKMSRDELRLQERCGNVDFLIGGPPCQGHSDLNNHTRRDDPRNDLYGVMGRAASVVKPRFIIIENVLGVRHSATGVVQKTLSHLNALGYRTASITLNAANFGVAQNRKRHFTLAMAGDPERLQRTIESLQQPVRPVMWAIDDLMGEADSLDSPFHTAAIHSATNKKRIDYLFAHDLYELPDAQRPDCHRLKPHAYNSVYGRMRAEVQSPTITSGFGSTGQGRFVHPYKKRTITPHEAARIQFFPDWFRFSGLGRRQLQKYIGNAVPPKLGYVLALSLLNSEIADA